MANFIEIDFLSVESKKSGDAITIRYSIDGVETIHVVDAGFKSSGTSVCAHIKAHYGNPSKIDNVVVTHSDQDHAGGIQIILDEFEVGALWMLRPWTYAAELIHRFSRFTNVSNLETRLRNIYPTIAKIEKIALDEGIPIYEPFQGSNIGIFEVCSPTKSRYLDLIVESDKTPEDVKEDTAVLAQSLSNIFTEMAKTLIAAIWGEEKFSPNETSAENEMSVVQFASFEGNGVLLTADTGRAGLEETATFLENKYFSVPDIHYFQVPHHGSRRNVSTETLDKLLGEKSSNQQDLSTSSFQAIISSSKEDKHHPRKSVVRAMIHRNRKTFATEGNSIVTGVNRPDRDGWSSANLLEYPTENEA